MGAIPTWQAVNSILDWHFENEVDISRPKLSAVLYISTSEAMKSGVAHPLDIFFSYLYLPNIPSVFDYYSEGKPGANIRKFMKNTDSIAYTSPGFSEIAHPISRRLSGFNWKEVSEVIRTDDSGWRKGFDRAEEGNWENSFILPNEVKADTSYYSLIGKVD